MNALAQNSQVAGNWLRLFERHPAAWLVLGLVLVLLADGSIRLSIADVAVTLLPQLDAAIKAAFRVIGFFLLLLITYIYASAKISDHRQTVFVAIAVVWLLTVGFSIYAYIGRGDNKLMASYWDYDLERRTFTIQLTPSALSAHEGKFLVLVAREIDPTSSFRDDGKVVISPSAFAIGPVDREVQYSIDMSALKDALRLGDWVECQVILMSKKHSDSARTVTELLQAGGTELFRNPPKTVISVQKPTIPAIIWVIDSLGEGDKKTLLTRLQS